MLKAGRELLSAGVPVNIGSTHSPLNTAHVDSLIELCCQEGFDYIHFSPMMPISSCAGQKSVCLDGETRRQFRAAAAAIVERYQGRIWVEFSEMIVDPPQLQSAIKEINTTDKIIGLCGAGKTRCAINQLVNDYRATFYARFPEEMYITMVLPKFGNIRRCCTGCAGGGSWPAGPVLIARFLIIAPANARNTRLYIMEISDAPNRYAAMYQQRLEKALMNAATRLHLHSIMRAQVRQQISRLPDTGLHIFP